jgi:signal transduction histidine kinase
VRKDRRPPPNERSERLAPRHWSLRTKLAIVLLVPAVLAVALGGLRIAEELWQAGELDRISRFITAQGEVSTLVERLQQERVLATEHVVDGRTGDAAAMQQAAADVDAAGAAVGPTVQGLYTDEESLAGAHRQVDQALARLPGLRTLVTTSNAPASAVISRYSDLIASIVALDDVLLRGVHTTEGGGLVTALAALSSVRDEASLQEAMMIVAARDGAGVDLVELQSSQVRLQQGLEDFRGALDAGQRVRYATLIAGPTNTERSSMLDGVVAGSLRPGPGGLDAQAVRSLYEAFLGELDQAEDGVRNELTAIGASARQNAVMLVAVNAVVLVLALLIGALVVGLIARQMLRSLRTLRREAMEVADTRLPEAVARMRQGTVPDTEITPVAVSTREEVGEVARAFDAVHAQAVRLAAEQATLQADVNAMFVNLSRRSQTLVDRQLKLIEELEAGVADPDQLATLSRLDHLATRMRRNSENLLVLAGTDLAQRTASPVAAVELLHASVSGVEQYRRVVVEAPPEVAVAGRLAGDLQHLLAELLENATNFSPPDSQVVMSSSCTADGAFLIEIADAGVGLPVAELAQVNDQLRNAGEATVEASRRMGLFVVGRLAGRHGIDVGLFGGSSVAGPGAGNPGTPGAGMTARVWVPRHLVADRADRTVGQPHPGERGQHDGDEGAPGTPQQRTASGTVPSLPARLQLPDGDSLPIRRPRRAVAEAAVTDERPTPSEPQPPAQRQPVESLPAESPPDGSPQVEPAAVAEPVPVEQPREPAPAEAQQLEPQPHPVEPSGPEVPAQRGGYAATAPEVVELSMSSTDAQGLFAAATPSAPLPDPFAAERPRDPFALPVDEPGTPIFTEVASGWFRVQPPSGQPAAAESWPVAADVDVGHGSSSWEQPNRDHVEHDMAGGEQIDDQDRPAGRPAPRAWGPPRYAPGGSPARPWAEPDAPAGPADPWQGEGRGEPPTEAVPAASAPRPAPRPAPIPPAHRTPEFGGGPGPVFGSGQESPTLPQRARAPLPQPPEHLPVYAAEHPHGVEFPTAADSGWRAAEAIGGQHGPTEVTAAGLPRRTPLARLVPGSAAASEPAQRSPRRDAEAVRGRLTSYQRGVRSGRENRERSSAGEHSGGEHAGQP